MMSDTFVQGIYGYAIETDTHKNEPGVILASYTWEDDAAKMLSIQDENELAKKCLEELDRIVLESENINEPISKYVDKDKPHIIHWSKTKLRRLFKTLS